MEVSSVKTKSNSKELEDSLRELSDIKHALAESTIVAFTDQTGKITYVNDKFCEISKYGREELLGEDHRIINSGYHSKEFFRELWKTIANGKTWRGEICNRAKDGSIYWVMTTIVPFLNEENKPYQYVAIRHDITDQKSANEQIKKQASFLKETEHQLLRAQRLESIGTLAGGIAHDLNNVLSPILMAVDMLDADFDLPDSSQPWLSIIRENTERGAELIKQVLTFARGADESNREQIQVSYLIKELISVWKKTLPTNINIEYNIEPQMPLISSDSTQIHQILMNLVVNAKDAMKALGGTLKIVAKSVSVDENYAQMNPDAKSGQYILISVEDTGIGMSAETLERIWDPFFTTKEVGEGTGLGLSTTLSLVKANGGFVNAYSELDKGTRFSVYLPAIESVSKKESTEKQDAAFPKGNGEVILIVDDEENIRRITSATLEKYGYKTLTAADGTEALAIYSQQEKIDLVITDMAMPYMDGAATIRALRKINPEQKIIAASGLTTAQQTESRELKVNDFLAKPFTSEKLLNAIADVLF